MKKILAGAVLMAVFLGATVSFAASPWASGANYQDKVTQKFGFGLTNLVFGWTQIVTQPMDYNKAGKNVFKGAGVGVVNFLADTVGGALHLVTFLVPQIDVPLPDNGVKLS